MRARQGILAGMVLASIVAAGLARGSGAHDDDDQAQARRARAAGEIVSLETILAAVDAGFRGQVIEVDLERDDGRWQYEIELLTADGHVIELTYDAATAKLLEAEGRGVERARRTP